MTEAALGTQVFWLFPWHLCPSLLPGQMSLEVLLASLVPGGYGLEEPTWEGAGLGPPSGTEVMGPALSP